MTAPLKQDTTIVDVALENRAYDIVIGRDVLASLGARVAALRPGVRTAIVTDKTVAKHWLAQTEASLAAAQYYAHPRNHFWPILGDVLREPLAQLPYAERLARVKAHRVAIWDTIVACERSGSLDSAIRNAEQGEIHCVHRLAREMRAVCFNGKTAARARAAWAEAGYATLVMPSTSPAFTVGRSNSLANSPRILAAVRGSFVSTRPVGPARCSSSRPRPRRSGT